MNQRKILGLSAGLALVSLIGLLAGGLVLSAQTFPGPVMSTPPREFGGSITPAYEGWFDNADGSHNFLIGYYNRNTKEEVDIPLGPNNKFDTKEDMGQPTHFLTRRRYGYFIVTVPKEFSKTQKISWTLTHAGVTTTIPFQLHTDYNISPFKASEESPGGKFNAPPKIRFAEPPSSPSLNGPMATGLKVLADAKATVGEPLAIKVYVDDDGLHASGNGAPPRPNEKPIEVEVTKYRGPGAVTIKEGELNITKGGKVMEPASGDVSATATFSAPGDYMLHIHAQDYSGKGGAGTGCCWGTAIIKVVVSAKAGSAVGGQ